MVAATVKRPDDSLPAFLAGLQSGMTGVLWMLAWLGVSAAWQGRSFWTSENLMASAFYGGESIRRGFATQTLPGLALYLLLYSALGALFAMALGGRLSRSRTVLVSVVFALAWYFVSFQLLWKSMIPLVALLHAARPTVLGHVVYGIVLGRFPGHMEKAVNAEAEPEKPEEGAGQEAYPTNPTQD